MTKQVCGVTVNAKEALERICRKEKTMSDEVYTDEDKAVAAKEVVDMITSPNSRLVQTKDGSADVYSVMVGKEQKATVVMVSSTNSDENVWRIYGGKLKDIGTGTFVEGSPFDEALNSGKGIKEAIESKMRTQKVLEMRCAHIRG